MRSNALTAPRATDETTPDPDRHVLATTDTPLYRLVAFECGLPGGDDPMTPGAVLAPSAGTFIQPDVLTRPGSPDYVEVLTVTADVARALGLHRAAGGAVMDDAPVIEGAVITADGEPVTTGGLALVDALAAGVQTLRTESTPPAGTPRRPNPRKTA